MKKKEFRIELVFLIAVFVFLFCGRLSSRLMHRRMRRCGIKLWFFIARHGTLPRREPGSQDAMWGISYGFNPILSYIFRRGLSKSHHFFTSGEQALLVAARMVNVLLGTGFAFYGAADRTAAVSKAGRMVFHASGDVSAGLSVRVFLCQHGWTGAVLDGPDHSDVGAGTGKRLGNQDVCRTRYGNRTVCHVILQRIRSDPREHSVFCVTVLLCRDRKWDVRFLLSGDC